MQIGDLVFVHGGAQSHYAYTTPGSWGYVSRKPTGQGGIYYSVYVRFEYFGEDSHQYVNPEENTEYDILDRHLCVLPEPPGTHAKITEVVTALAKLFREGQDDADR